MADIIDISKLPPYTQSEPTIHIRFVERDGKRILQQMHEVKTFDPNTIRCVGLHGEWRDVPLEQE